MNAIEWLRETWTANEPPGWVLIAVVCVLALYKFMTWNFGIFKSLGVPGPRPWPMIGSMIPLMSLGLPKHDLEMKRRYGSVVGTFFGRKPVLIIYDLDFVKALMVKDFNNFQNRMPVNFPDYPLRKILTSLTDDHWKHVRNTLTPMFSSGRLRKTQQVLENCAETLATNMQKMADTNVTFEFRDYCSAYTMDVIACTAFGLQIDSHNDPNNPFVRMSNKALQFTLANIRTLIFFFLPFLVDPLSKVGYTVFPKDVMGFFVQTVETALAERKKDTSGKNRDDFLQLMVEAEAEYAESERQNAADGGSKKGNEMSNRRGLNHEEVLAQSMGFIFAGYDTTASTLAFLGYSLAVNSECQDKLIAEIDEIMRGQDVDTFEAINKMQYLDMCVCETLRLYPPAARTDRIAGEDITINGLLIPKGMIIAVPIYALHNDPEYWPEPEKFDPERFTPEARAGRNQYCYMPFSLGPRNCAGMRLAQMILKIAIVSILRKFRFVACEETQIPMVLEKVRMRGTEGVKIRIEARAAQS